MLRSSKGRQKTNAGAVANEFDLALCAHRSIWAARPTNLATEEGWQ